MRSRRRSEPARLGWRETCRSRTRGRRAGGKTRWNRSFRPVALVVAVVVGQLLQVGIQGEGITVKVACQPLWVGSCRQSRSRIHACCVRARLCGMDALALSTRTTFTLGTATLSMQCRKRQLHGQIQRDAGCAECRRAPLDAS